jgi:hypothetical protein
MPKKTLTKSFVQLKPEDAKNFLKQCKAKLCFPVQLKCVLKNKIIWSLQYVPAEKDVRKISNTEYRISVTFYDDFLEKFQYTKSKLISRLIDNEDLFWDNIIISKARLWQYEKWIWLANKKEGTYCLLNQLPATF